MREAYYQSTGGDYGQQTYQQTSDSGSGGPTGSNPLDDLPTFPTSPYSDMPTDENSNFDLDEYLDSIGVGVHDDIRGFLPGTQGMDTAYNRMIDNQAFYRNDYGRTMEGLKTQGTAQMSKIAGNQGLMSGMGGGFGAKQSGMIKDIGQVRSAYSQDMAGGLLNFQRDMQQSEYGFEDAQVKYGDDLINRLIQLQGLYKDEEYITFT